MNRILERLLLALTLAACSGSEDGRDDETASCQQAGMTCAKSEDCNQWDCHCPEDAGGESVAFIVAFCNDDGLCASASEACEGICVAAIAPDQATNAGCQ